MRCGALIFLFCLALLPACGADVSAAGAPALRVVVLDNVPPMSFRDERGELTGFSVEIARAVCVEMRAACVFEAVAQSALVDIIADGKADFAAVGLLETPERRAKLLFAKPYYRSRSLWLAPAGVKPGQAGVRVAVVSASAQETYGRNQGWALHSVLNYSELGDPLIAGLAQAMLVPMISAISLQKSDAFRRLDLSTTVLLAPGLGSDAAFGISPQRPELREEINAALDRIKRNGTYDRINSRFLPFRVS